MAEPEKYGPQNAYRQRHRELGLCLYCSNPAAQKKRGKGPAQMCKDCRDKREEASQAQRKLFRKLLSAAKSDGALA